MADCGPALTQQTAGLPVEPEKQPVLMIELGSEPVLMPVAEERPRRVHSMPRNTPSMRRRYSGTIPAPRATPAHRSTSARM